VINQNLPRGRPCHADLAWNNKTKTKRSRDKLPGKVLAFECQELCVHGCGSKGPETEFSRNAWQVLVNAKICQPFVLVPGGSEKELVTRRKLSTDKVPTSAFEEQKLISKTRYAVEVVILKFLSSEKTAHGLESGKELEPGRAIKSLGYRFPKRAAKELPQVQVKDDLFSRIQVVDGWGSKIQLSALEEVRNFIKHGKTMGGLTTLGRSEE
jgi:hypothetical protein